MASGRAGDPYDLMSGWWPWETLEGLVAQRANSVPFGCLSETYVFDSLSKCIVALFQA
jgi:hypothetical protein